MNQVKLQSVFHRILLERGRQDQLKAQGRFMFTCAEEHGLTPAQKYMVLGEEMGEVARVVLNLNGLATDFRNSMLTTSMRTTMLEEKLQKELTEVAAVACAWLESMELEPTEGMQL